MTLRVKNDYFVSIVIVFATNPDSTGTIGKSDGFSEVLVRRVYTSQLRGDLHRNTKIEFFLT